MEGDVKRRPYRSERRREQAEETRTKVLDAAGALFEERGYEGTSVAAIAAAAGVSQETIYARFGNKRALLGELVARAVRGADPRPVPQQEGPRSLAAASDQREQLRLFAADIAERLERAAPLVALIGAARAEPELTELLERLHAERLGNLQVVVDSLLRNGTLRLPEKEALETTLGAHEPGTPPTPRPRPSLESLTLPRLARGQPHHSPTTVPSAAGWFWQRRRGGRVRRSRPSWAALSQLWGSGVARSRGRGWMGFMTSRARGSRARSVTRTSSGWS